MSGDPHWANVVLLVGAEGADGSTTILDESPVARTLTTLTGAQIDTGQFKFGTSSAQVLSSSAITAPDSIDWVYPGQFTVECWLRPSPAMTTFDIMVVGQWTTAGNRSWILSLTKGTPRLVGFRLSADGTASTHQLSATHAWLDNAWMHVAVDRDASDKLRLYVDGVMVASKTSATGSNFNSTLNLQIAVSPSGFFNFQGHIDELRITKGVARYASDSGFTVPSAAFERGVFVPVAGSKYGIGTYGIGPYSKLSVYVKELLSGVIPVLFATAGRMGNSQLIKTNTYVAFSTSARITVGQSYRANVSVDFNVVGSLRRVGDGRLAASVPVNFDWVSKSLYNSKPLGGDFLFQFSTYSDEYIGLMWSPMPPCQSEWAPMTCPIGDEFWVPIEENKWDNPNG